MEAHPMPAAYLAGVHVEEQRLGLRRPRRGRAIPQDADAADPKTVKHGREWRWRADRIRSHAISLSEIPHADNVSVCHPDAARQGGRAMQPHRAEIISSWTAP
jgi:hypothetical protein